MGLILQGEGAARDDVREHLAQCPSCAAEVEVAEFLKAEGRERRKHDLSPAAIRETRRRAADVLAGAGRQTAGGRPDAIPAGLWTHPAAVPAAAVLLIAVACLTAVYVGNRRASSRTRPGKPVPTTTVASRPPTLDEEIRALQSDVAYGVFRFRRRYAGAERRSPFEDRRSDLRARIAVYSMRLETELQESPVERREDGADDGAPRNGGRNGRKQQEGVQNGHTLQMEPGRLDFAHCVRLRRTAGDRRAAG
jgi:hypothetical protein